MPININNAIANLGSVPAASAGVFANRPTAPVNGYVYFSQDTQEIWQYVSNVWVLIASNGGGGSQDLQSVLNVGNTADENIYLENNLGTNLIRVKDTAVNVQSTITPVGIAMLDNTGGSANIQNSNNILLQDLISGTNYALSVGQQQIVVTDYSTFATTVVTTYTQALITVTDQINLFQLIMPVAAGKNADVNIRAESGDVELAQKPAIDVGIDIAAAGGTYTINNVTPGLYQIETGGTLELGEPTGSFKNGATIYICFRANATNLTIAPAPLSPVTSIEGHDVSKINGGLITAVYYNTKWYTLAKAI